MSIWQLILLIVGAVLAYILLGRVTRTTAKIVGFKEDDLPSVFLFWWLFWIFVIVIAAIELVKFIWKLFVKLFTKVLFPAMDWCGRGLGWLLKKLD